MEFKVTDHKILPECERVFKEHDKEIDGMKKAMFGADGLSGVCGCLKGKVSRKTLAVIAIAMTGFIIAGLTAWGGAKDERSTAESRTTSRISRLERRKRMRILALIQERQQESQFFH